MFGTEADFEFYCTGGLFLYCINLAGKHFSSFGSAIDKFSRRGLGLREFEPREFEPREFEAKGI